MWIESIVENAVSLFVKMTFILVKCYNYPYTRNTGVNKSSAVLSKKRSKSSAVGIYLLTIFASLDAMWSKVEWISWSLLDDVDIIILSKKETNLKRIFSPGNAADPSLAHTNLVWVCSHTHSSVFIYQRSLVLLQPPGENHEADHQTPL